eukprot:symbB.v1.2.020982.t1/scaffold1790.1/size152476/7
MVFRTRKAFPILAIALLASQACFFTTLRGVFGAQRREIQVRAEAPKPPAKVVAAKPASAPSPQATKAAAPAKDAKGANEAPVPTPAAAAPASGLETLKVSRKKMSKELEDIAKDLGILTNVTRSDLKLFGLIKEKVVAKGSGPPKLKDLEERMVRADLALMLEEPSSEVASFELVSMAMDKATELEEAKAQIAELETSLAESQERSNMLLEGLKEIGNLVGVGGFGGLMQFFMSDEDIIKETKQKVQAKR